MRRIRWVEPSQLRSLLLAAKPQILGQLAVADLPHLVATKLYAGDLAPRGCA